VGDIGCGLIGCGTVGSGVVRSWAAAGGAPRAARLLAVAVRRPQLRRSVDLTGLRVTGDALAVARDLVAKAAGKLQSQLAGTAA
jgi:homoserine dehydrogenase